MAAGPERGDHPRRGGRAEEAELLREPQILPGSDSTLVFVQQKQTRGYLALTPRGGEGGVTFCSPELARLNLDTGSQYC